MKLPMALPAITHPLACPAGNVANRTASPEGSIDNVYEQSVKHFEVDSILTGTILDVINDDVIDGGNHNDTIFGETGDDTLYGEGGADLLYGNADADTLFGGGCGRVFEGTVEQMYRSLTRLTALPPETEIYWHLARLLDIPDEFLRDRIPEPSDEAVEAFLERRLEPFDGLSLARLREGPVLPPGHEEIAFANGEFPTPSGRIELVSLEAGQRWGIDPLPVFEEAVESVQARSAANEYPLYLMTPNTKNRIHSQFGNLRSIRAVSRGPTAQVHPGDANARGIHDGDRIRVFNDRGGFHVDAQLDAAGQRLRERARRQRGSRAAPNRRTSSANVPRSSAANGKRKSVANGTSRLWASERTAAFVAAYTLLYAPPARQASEDISTSPPPPRARSFSTASWASSVSFADSRTRW